MNIDFFFSFHVLKKKKTCQVEKKKNKTNKLNKLNQDTRTTGEKKIREQKTPRQKKEKKALTFLRVSKKKKRIYVRKKSNFNNLKLKIKNK